MVKTGEGANYSRGLFVLCQALTWWATATFAQSVLEERGNIYFEKASGQKIQVSDSERDSEPRLSPNKRMVAFVRNTPERINKQFVPDLPANEIWIVDLRSKKSKCLVRGRGSPPGYVAGRDPKLDQKKALAGLSRPRFSPDSKRIFFMSGEWATTRAIHVVEVGTGKERFFAFGAGILEVIGRGRYAGYVVDVEHKYIKDAGSYDPHCLLDPHGREVRCFGEEPPAQFAGLYVE